MKRDQRDRKNRAKTLRTLIQGTMSEYSTHWGSVITGEMNELVKTHTVTPPRRRWLLQILHTSRALESCLLCFVNYHGIRDPADRALGQYLTRLTNHPRGPIANLSESSRSKYQAEVVDKRNKYLHVAGAYPNGEPEVGSILGGAEACLVEVLALDQWN
jgi:hypothetical protein